MLYAEEQQSSEKWLLNLVLIKEVPFSGGFELIDVDCVALAYSEACFQGRQHLI